MCMKIFESLEITEKFPKPVLTIGNYDGLHIGHRKIIKRVIEKAASISGTSMLMTLQPHPLSILKPEKHMGYITPLEVKKKLIAEAGVDVLLVVPFTKEFSAISPESYVKDILLATLGIKGLIVGYDFRFGTEARGDVGMLKAFSEIYDFYFEVVEAITLSGEKIGSNKIRKLILEGDMNKTERLLGRPYMIIGNIIKGKGRGKGMGFPTINLRTDFELIPKRGVYITEVEIEGRRHPSVTNIGYNPTFEEEIGLSIETFIIDLSDELYDRQVSIYFRDRIRDEIKFDNAEVLLKRIRTDVEIARRYFS